MVGWAREVRLSFSFIHLGIPDSCYFLDFSLSSLYDRAFLKSCPVASRSEIVLTIPVDSSAPFTIEPKGGMTTRQDISSGRQEAVWDTTSCMYCFTLDGDELTDAALISLTRRFA